MNLEAHPALHYEVVLVFYHIGLLMNVLAGAHLATRSQLNAVASVKQYFALRWIPIGIRWFACLCMFLILWENNSVINLERFMPNLAAHLGVAGGLGFTSDALWDKVLAIVLPGVQKELPPIPPEQP